MIAFFLLLIYSTEGISYGYDSGSDQGACGKAYRSSRMFQPPCDLNHQAYCATAGSMYPWHAVRRFIRENQGLMRRMYGDERHIAVLRAELDTNDINDIHDSYSTHEESLRREFKNRYAKQESLFENELLKGEDTKRFQETHKRDDILNTKFVYSEEPNLSVKLSDLKTMPHFRPTSPKPIKITTPLLNDTNDNSTMENTTETTTLQEEESTIYDTSTEYTTTEQTETTTLLQEETTTENIKKETVGNMLFQDFASNSNSNNNNKKVQNHINFNVRGVNACPVKEEVVAPFWANNTRGEVLALLNHYPFEQYVHWEKCTYENRQMYCREGCRCEQKYRLHRLLAFDPNNECKGIFSDWFRFPSCCVCKCYNIPTEFRVTSRSPRGKDNNGIKSPVWFKKRNESN